MNLAVFSHKPCWRSAVSPTGFATDGGFPMQMAALSELFESTRLVVPCLPGGARSGETALQGRHLTVVPVAMPRGGDSTRKLALPAWFARHGALLVREVRRADAVHTPIPGDIGTLGMLIAYGLRKPLFVRHCGNWLAPRTAAERFWRNFMEKHAGGRNVMLATGGGDDPPSTRNANVRWIFSTSLREEEVSRLAQPRCAVDRDRLVMVHVGRQELEKGAGVALRALPLLPGAVLHVVGDGSALTRWRSEATELGLADRVVFHGRVGHEAVIDALRAANLFVFPTTSSEGFPKAVHEALACGLPVVTTRVSVLPSLIGRGCGVLLDHATPEAVAAAVRACTSSADEYARMSETALQVAREYTLERWRDTIGSLLGRAWGETLR